MALLEIINISHSFGDNMLYENASFELFKGEHMGMVGQNGTGKTTLMNSLIGEAIPDSGEIRWQKGIKIGYLDQHAKISSSVSIFDYLKTAFADLYNIETELNKIYDDMSNDCNEVSLDKVSDYQSLLLNSGFYDIDTTILKVADGLGITALGMDSELGNLSGGQRAKVILAKMLLEKPNMMLLDEPTNFLDREHIDWLTEYLIVFEGAYIVISHDFDFLDRITTCICDIEFGTITKYSGNFSKFIELKGFRKESYVREFVAQQRVIAKFEDYIAKNKARAATAGMARSRQKQLNKIEVIDPLKQVTRPDFHFVSLPITGQKTLVVNDLEIGYDHPLLPKLNFEVLSGQKVVITGFNGIGKSTLLKTLIGQIPKISGHYEFANGIKIAYFEQDLKWDAGFFSPAQIVSDKYPKLSEKQMRRYLAQCGIPAKNASQAIETLSGGEQAKVKLCLLMLKDANLLILDEPTNHLDSQAKEVLKEQLIEWQGSLIMVLHDTEFYKDITDKVINIENLR